MNYIEIVARQEELQKEMLELQEARVASAQAHEDIQAEFATEEGVNVKLTMNYGSGDSDILMLDNYNEFDKAIHLTVGDFNEISQFLGKYNDAIFSYMSELDKEKADTDGIIEEDIA